MHEDPSELNRKLDQVEIEQSAEQADRLSHEDEILRMTEEVTRIKSGIRYLIGRLTPEDKVRLEDLYKQLDMEFEKIIDKKPSS
ncbi:hypothetical protein A2774_02570 [Candidatus Roizmanbacteria bacterium RIFCSPHIGHO2_01_FULL_39_12c]|uniref:Uncharacterized protein n=1 Tax=Candidatus Roizmanbacteria bacterium RIFCSPHIGHO2_01_FULL_39_12c TaxID=1802031 RepID=A0A1F7GD21_9BACT|nr:MAG: hypothetical protein A2774_02570 [Candidatus Roizmanbacteria bacterium RIFCSPHIGHO2_01_FULL_39_12c]